MFIAIIFFLDGSSKEHTFNNYPDEYDFEMAGYNWDDILSFEVHF